MIINFLNFCYVSFFVFKEKDFKLTFFWNCLPVSFFAINLFERIVFFVCQNVFRQLQHFLALD